MGGMEYGEIVLVTLLKSQNLAVPKATWGLEIPFLLKLMFVASETQFIPESEFFHYI